jgi:transcriptional regulator with XRE-family HTH domain
MNTLGQKIRKIREIKGYSQEYIARELGITQEAYSYLENAKKQIPDGQLFQLATLFGVSSDFIKLFDPQNVITNTFNDQSNGYFNVEKLTIQTQDAAIKALEETIRLLKEKVALLEKTKSTTYVKK